MARVKIPRTPAVLDGLSRDEQELLDRAARMLKRHGSDLLLPNLPVTSPKPSSLGVLVATSVPAASTSLSECGPATVSTSTLAGQPTFGLAEDEAAVTQDFASYSYTDMHEWATQANQYHDKEYIGENEDTLDLWTEDSTSLPAMPRSPLVDAGRTGAVTAGPTGVRLTTGVPNVLQISQGKSLQQPTFTRQPSSSIETNANDRRLGHSETDDMGGQNHHDMEICETIEPSQVMSQDWASVGVTPVLNISDGIVSSNSVGNDLVGWVSVDPRRPSIQPRQQRRRPFQDQQLREETGKTRVLKACVRCRMQKLRCQIVENDPTGICGTCLTVSSQKVHTLPCLRHRLTESTLFRTGKPPGMEFTFRWPVMKLRDITDWASTEVRSILVKSDVCPVPLQLSVRRFAPTPRDSLHRAWMNGKVKKFKETTPWAIVNMKSAMHDMREYVTTNVFTCVDHFLKNADPLVKMTYEFALSYMKRVQSEEERKLLGNFMRLWVAVRRTATTEHIIGNETLDMIPEQEDRSCPHFGKIPLPPVMIQQLDMILTLGILLTLQKQVLEDLQRIVLANNPKSWMTIYLVTFMSLHSCAKITAENFRNARKQGFRRRYTFPSFISERHHTANVFLSHYHYRTETCNPFMLNWKRRHTTPFADMVTDDIHFLVKTREMVTERAANIRINNEEELYENELYFVAQMFDENWQPRDTKIDYDGGTIYDGPLKKYYGMSPSA